MQMLDAIANPMIADVGGSFRQGQERGRANLSRKMVGDIIGNTFGGRLGKLGEINPEAAMVLGKVLGIPANELERQQAFFGNHQAFNAILNGSGAKDAEAFLSEIIANTEETTGEPAVRYRAQLKLLQEDPEQARQGSNTLVQSAYDSGFLRDPRGDRGAAKFSAKTEILEDGSTLQADNEGNIVVRTSSGTLVEGADAAAVIREAMLAGANMQGLRSEERTRGSQRANLSLAPQIASAVKNAETLAQESGAAFTDFTRMGAALPGLRDTVDQLKNLSGIATSTMGGRVFDIASKELGFGSTKGANASAKWVAIVNNQVLPLLKPTFGAAFTVAEGNSLRATMGDVNASPAEKMATLEAFIAQKEQDIITKGRELNAFSSAENAATATPASDLSNMTDEQLQQLRREAAQ